MWGLALWIGGAVAAGFAHLPAQRLMARRKPLRDWDLRERKQALTPGWRAIVLYAILVTAVWMLSAFAGVNLDLGRLVVAVALLLAATAVWWLLVWITIRNVRRYLSHPER